MSNRRPTKCRAVKIGDVNILKVVGRITPDENDDLLFNAVNLLAERGEKNFLLELSAVSYINSTGIGSIIQAYRLAQSKGGTVKILTPSQCVTHIMQVSKLDNIFEIFQDQQLALDSFSLPPSENGLAKRSRGRKAAAEPKEE
jgi:anti-sigma B factor antagonist